MQKMLRAVEYELMCAKENWQRTKTLMYPNIDSVGLSRIQLTLYSKF